MIIQGSNEPIIVNVDSTDTVVKMELHLYTKDGNTLKHWNVDDVDIKHEADKSVITAPLTEEETMGFERGRAKLEIKWLDDNGNIKHCDIASLEIVERKDRTRMM